MINNIKGKIMRYTLFEKTINITNNGESRIIIGADFVPTDSNKVLFQKRETNKIFGNDLYTLFQQSDLNILNLEAPITKVQEKLFKVGGPNLKIYPECINVLKDLKPLLLSGANNHIKDYQDNGIRETLSLLSDAEIDSIGFGLNKNIARKPRIYKMNNITIGIYSCSENEFCCASDNQGGGNGYDPLYTFDDIKNLKDNCDIVVVLFHAGRENYRYPSIQLQRICHKMVDSGTDLIVCQHSHCIGSYEKYMNSLIVYGQGNVLFDYIQREEWATAILLELKISRDNIAISAIPIVKQGNCVSMADEKSAIQIIEKFHMRADNIQQPNFIEHEWLRFLSCGNQKQILLLSGVLGINNRILTAVDRILFKGKLTDQLFSRKRSQLLLNYIRCESIRESLMTLLDRDK